MEVGGIEELDLRNTIYNPRWSGWPNVSGVVDWVQQVNVSAVELSIPQSLQTWLNYAPQPPRGVGWTLLAAVLLFVMQVCVVGCHRRHLLKNYAHAKRL